MNKLLGTLLLLVILFDIGSRVVYAQSNGANFIGSLSGTTVTNCGTPTTPSLCSVGTGVFIWQNSTTGWFLLTPPGAAGVQTVNGAKPGTSGNVTVACSSGGFAAEAAAPSVSGGTISISVPAETIAVNCTGSGS